MIRHTIQILPAQAMGAGGPPVPPSPLIRQAIDEHPYPLLLVSVSGAHLYGFPSRDSDIDLRGVYALPTSEVIGLEQGPDRIERVPREGEAPSIDMVTYDVRKLVTFLLQKNGNALEMIFSPLVAASSETWHSELSMLASQTITRFHERHYRGFAMGTWKALHKRAEREKKGVKHLLYLYRTLLTGIFLMRTGVVESHLPSLLEMIPVEGVQDLIERKREGEEQQGITEDEVLLHEKRYTNLMETLEQTMLTSERRTEVSPTTKRALHHLVCRARLAATDEGEDR